MKEFNVYNEKDMDDLFDILPDRISEIKLFETYNGSGLSPCLKVMWIANDGTIIPVDLFNIKWEDKKVIYRPTKESTEKDIGKLCKMWDSNENYPFYTVLDEIKYENGHKSYRGKHTTWHEHCRRFTPEEKETLV